jgi:hypothetical protein
MEPNVHFHPMRSFLAGFFCILVGLSPAAWGQVDPSSFVESMGFNRAYRPDAWVPMVVNLKSTLGEPAEYQIQVVQPDIDGDRVVYSRLVTLNANAAEKYWVYFRPQPTGLEALTVAELQKMLRVRLCTRDGKELMILPLTTTLADFDPKTGFNTRRGKKMVLAVIGGTSQPAWLDYDPNTAIGLVEDVEFIKVGTDDLPESALGYEMVDTIVWFDADASALTTGGSRKLAAMQEWIRQGGQLVVCHPDEPFRIAPFADMLPVHLKAPDDKWVAEVINRDDPEPLHRIATARIVDNASDPDPDIRASRLIADNWNRMKGPFRVARAPLKNDAVAEEWVEWKPEHGGGRTPYIARNAVGLGSVTWVAQNLGDRTITGRESSGWPHVWDRVFGWKNQTVLVKLSNPQARNEVWGKAIDEWGAGQMADLGGVFLRATDHTGKAGAYVFLVILFFVGYWIVAGPGSYLFLAGKGQRQLSWAVFAVSALAATLLTVAVVKLVLRGDPEVRHVSVVRLAPGNPTVVDSRIGLYIPRDGRQHVNLKNTVPDAASYITPLAIHPQHLGNPATFSDTAEYVIPVREVTGDDPVGVDVPYRSTLKKVQTHWVGNMPEGIEGWAGLVGQQSVETDVGGKMVKAGVIEGRLANKTGHDLKHVLFAFRFQQAEDDGTLQDQEYVLYVPAWKKDQALDLLRAFASADQLSDKTHDTFARGIQSEPLRGTLSGPNSWGEHWLRYMKTLARTDNLVDDSERPVTQSVAVMMLFDRIQPLKNAPYLSYSRAELLRRGGRSLNLSHAMAAGNLVMIAKVDKAPLPFPLEVEGDRMTGEGTVYYQASIPLKNRTTLIEPLFTTKPKQPEAATEDGTAPAAEDAGQSLPPTDPAAEPAVQ